MHFTWWIVLTSSLLRTRKWSHHLMRPGKWVWWSMAWLYKLFQTSWWFFTLKFLGVYGCFMILNLIFTHIFQMGWQRKSATIVMEVLRLEIPDGWVLSWKIGRESLSLPMKNCKTCVRNDERKATDLDFTPLRHLHIFIAVVCWCVACWVLVFN